MQPFCLSCSPECWEIRGVNGQLYSCQDFSMFILQASPPFDICKGYHHPRSPTLNPASQEKEKALGWKPTNPFVWLVTIPSPALGQILFSIAFPYMPRLWGHSPVCCESGNMTGLAGWYVWLGWSGRERWAVWKKTLYTVDRGSPLHTGVLCTMISRSSGRYGLWCFASHLLYLLWLGTLST